MAKYVFLPTPDIIGVGNKKKYEKALYGKVAFDEWGRFWEIDPVFVWLPDGMVFDKDEDLTNWYLKRWHKTPMHYIVDLLLDELEFKYSIKSVAYPSDKWALKEAYENKLYLSLKTLEQNYNFRRGIFDE